MAASVGEVYNKDEGHICAVVFNTFYNVIQFIDCYPGDDQGQWHWPEYVE